MESNANALNWFEISVDDLERAQGFYEEIFDMKMIPLPEMLGMKMAGFPIEMMSGKVGGALAESENHIPSDEGVMVYLNANPDIQAVLDRVEDAGGEIDLPRTEISPEMGYMAYFIDTEGNRIGLHAQN
ncbi:MAG TPA: VOC family protein [Mucilaginibacter sp.]|jgi:predicted enzyme related to lactoylglutathione lyase|nr:VOC family protein [Mucilaginibacter sp.]